MPTTEELAEIAQAELQKERAREILLANKEVPVIRRLLNPNAYPAIRREDGSESSAVFSTYNYGPEETYGGVKLGGKTWVVPHVVYGDAGTLIERQPGDGTWDRTQIARGNAIPFDSFDEAEWFAQGKDSWKRHFGGLIPDVPPREAYPPQRKLAGPLEDALARAMANKSLALGPGSYPALP